MTTAIVTDSNVSLPLELLAALPVFVVPMEIHHDGQVFRDGLDLTPDAFYDLQRTAKRMPTTSAPQPGAFVEAFERAAQTADEIVCLTLSSELSATYAAAISAREVASAPLPGVRIEIVDSRSAGTAQGLVALAAGRLAATGADTETLLLNIGHWRSSVRLYGYLQSLYYVWKGGRVPRVLMWMGKLLDVKPVLGLADGKIGMVERPRTARGAMDRLVALAVESAGLGESAGGAQATIAVMHAAAPDAAEALAERLRTALAPDELFTTEFTPVIGAHTGPGLVGFSILRHDTPAT
jgi:DegV family protein with EDD domain